EVGLDDDFFELGGTSLLALRFVRVLAERTGHEPGIAQLFDRTTPRALVALLEGTDDQNESSMTTPRKSRNRSWGEGLDPIAVVGWAGRFPGAENIDEFWGNLDAGREGVRFFAKDELDPRVSDELKNDPSYVAARGVLNAPD